MSEAAGPSSSWPWLLASAPTTSPTLLAALFLALLVLFARIAAPHLQDDKPVADLEIVGMYSGDTEAKAKQRYADKSREILDEATKACLLLLPANKSDHLS